MSLRLHRPVVALFVGAALPLGAQVRDTAPPRPEPAPSANVSGVMYLTYRYGGILPNRSENRFDLDRAYITLRAPAGERLSARLTADVYQQRDSTRDAYYRGWAVRFKYAYGQYRAWTGAGGSAFDVRLGMLQTHVIEHEETFWPRALGPTAVDALGFFSSADVGASAIATLPSKWGEVYVGALNGDGYTSRERDRFKDYGARLTITPFGDAKDWRRTLAISPWYYDGTRASDFARGPGTLAPIVEGRRRDRYGVFAGLKDPRATLGVHYARRIDDVETADTLVDVSPTVTDRTGQLISAFTILRGSLVGGPQPFQVIFRHDLLRPNVDGDGFQRFVVAGLGWELSSKTTVWLDWQRNTAGDGATGADQSLMFIHAMVNY